MRWEEDYGPSCGAWTASFPRDLKLSNWSPRKFSSVEEAKPPNQSVPSLLQVQATGFLHRLSSPRGFGPTLFPALPASCLLVYFLNLAPPGWPQGRVAGPSVQGR